MTASITPNIRINLAGERAYVKKKMAALELSGSSSFQSNLVNKRKPSLESLPSTPKRSRFLSDASPTPTISRHTAALASVTTPMTPLHQELVEIYESDSNQDSDQIFLDPLNHALFQDRPIPSLHNQLPIINKPTDRPIPFYIPPARVSKKPRWPADFFAVDIVGCFDEVEDGAADVNVRSIFDAHFGLWVSYTKSTFYEHRQRWEAASLSTKHTVLSAGRTPAGCWSHVMSTTPGPRARIKAVRQAFNRSSSFLELSSDTNMHVN
jgi:hypothetical protein